MSQTFLSYFLPSTKEGAWDQLGSPWQSVKFTHSQAGAQRSYKVRTFPKNLPCHLSFNIKIEAIQIKVLSLSSVSKQPVLPNHVTKQYIL